MERSRRTWKRLGAAIAVLAALALPAAGCGGGGEPPPAHGSASSPGQLVRSSNQILGGGERAFKRQLDALRGHPIVVNKWASWCGPCRFEFKFFRNIANKLGRTIAFLGVDSRDSISEAKDFLQKFPVPYPSFYDRKGEIARAFRGDRAFPTTAFYNREGKLVFTKQGGYASEDALAKDITQYLQ